MLTEEAALSPDIPRICLSAADDFAIARRNSHRTKTDSLILYHGIIANNAFSSNNQH